MIQAFGEYVSPKDLSGTIFQMFFYPYSCQL